MTLKVAAAQGLGAFSLDVAFELPTPGVASLFGPSGCGKSSTINVIAGLLRPERGQVTLDYSTLLDTERGVDVPADAAATAVSMAATDVPILRQSSMKAPSLGSRRAAAAASG